jgi:hypothetical protein
MGFVKRNLVFVVLMAIAVLAVAALTILFFGKRGEAEERKVEAQKQIASLAQAKTLAYTVNEANLAQARKNRTVAGESFGSFLAGLAARSSFSVEPVHGVECKSRLREECTDLKVQLDRAGIGVTTEAADFSFGAVFYSPAIPTDADASQLLKQMKIVREIVQLALKMKPGAALLRINRMTSPADAARPSKDGVSRTQTFELVVRGAHASIQELVNQIDRSERGIFILRSFEMQSLDQAPGGVISPVLPVEKAGTTPRTSTAVPSVFGGPLVPTIPAGGAVAAPGTEAKKQMLSSKKEDRVAFQPHEVQATLLLDLVEFEPKKAAGEK